MGAFSIIMQVLFLIGFFLIVFQLVRSKAMKEAGPNKIIYRYIPRTFIEDQENPVPLDDIFYAMFNDRSAWVGSVDVDRRRRDIGENLNRFYVTQI